MSEIDWGGIREDIEIVCGELTTYFVYVSWEDLTKPAPEHNILEVKLKDSSILGQLYDYKKIDILMDNLQVKYGLRISYEESAFAASKGFTWRIDNEI